MHFLDIAAATDLLQRSGLKALLGTQEKLLCSYKNFRAFTSQAERTRSKSDMRVPFPGPNSIMLSLDGEFNPFQQCTHQTPISYICDWQSSLSIALPPQTFGLSLEKWQSLQLRQIHFEPCSIQNSDWPEPASTIKTRGRSSCSTCCMKVAMDKGPRSSIRDCKCFFARAKFSSVDWLPKLRLSACSFLFTLEKLCKQNCLTPLLTGEVVINFKAILTLRPQLHQKQLHQKQSERPGRWRTKEKY